jgi:hypothetical protein
MEDDERNGCPRSHKTDELLKKMWKLVHSNRHLSTRAMAVQLNLDKETAKRPKLWPNNWILHHVNAPAHKVLSVRVSGPKIDH